jgi:hypothetical protein
MTHDTQEEGFILTLDLEKEFDRCSWEYYHEALHTLDFGPQSITYAALLSNPTHPPTPTRRVKVNGRHSSPFRLHSGVP